MGSVFSKKNKLIKTAIEPAIERGITSLQSTLFKAFGKIAAAPKIYIGVIIPTATIGPNKITKMGIETVPPPKPEYPWIKPLIDKIIAEITKSLTLTSEIIWIKYSKSDSKMIRIPSNVSGPGSWCF